MVLKLSDITPTPTTISAPDTVKLSYTITSDPGSTETVTYSMDETLDVYFELADGTSTSKIDNPAVTLDATGKLLVDEKLKIVVKPDPAKGHSSQPNITVKVKETGSQLQATKMCTITLS